MVIRFLNPKATKFEKRAFKKKERPQSEPFLTKYILLYFSNLRGTFVMRKLVVFGPLKERIFSSMYSFSNAFN